MRKLSPCAIFQAFCLPDLNLSDRVASADSVQAENWFWCEVGVAPKTSSSYPILEEKGPPYYTLSEGEEKEDRACLSFEMKTHLWSAEIGPDWNWGGGDARMIPPLKLRGSGIADPGTHERGGGGFTVRSGIQGEQEGILNSRESTVKKEACAKNWPKMTFWQENYGFIKEVYDTRWRVNIGS